MDDFLGGISGGVGGRVAKLPGDPGRAQCDDSDIDERGVQDPYGAVRGRVCRSARRGDGDVTSAMSSRLQVSLQIMSISL